VPLALGTKVLGGLVEVVAYPYTLSRGKVSAEHGRAAAGVGGGGNLLDPLKTGVPPVV